MTTATLPKYTKALTIQPSSTKRKPLYHDTLLVKKPIPAPQKGEVLVRIGAAAFNHRDVWIRKGLYPRIVMGSVFGADGAGTIVASGDPDDPLLHKRVFLTPMRGWESDPYAPESQFGILGGGNFPSLGTFAEYVTVERDQVIPTPGYLDDVHASAWPLGGVTAWRAAIVYGRVESGQHVLITGIGGGVALLAMQLCIAKGASVYVTSGSKEKIQKAIALGAKGGGCYRDKHWASQLASLIPSGEHNDGSFDAVIDSGGGDIVAQVGKHLKEGGRVVCYGMTADPKITFTMREVMKNQQLIGSMMGSHQDLKDATDFLEEHRIVPIVSHVLEGLESTEDGFEIMGRGDQFGKIVIKMMPQRSHDKSKL